MSGDLYAFRNLKIHEEYLCNPRTINIMSGEEKLPDTQDEEELPDTEEERSCGTI